MNMQKLKQADAKILWAIRETSIPEYVKAELAEALVLLREETKRFSEIVEIEPDLRAEN